MNLPISEFADLIVQMVRSNKVTVVVGETGSGKTTQIPIFLYLAGLFGEKMIGITQPRRIAAISVADFVASEIGEELGKTVGYKVRFDDETAENTKIKFMTDGILLREMQSDPDLSKYSIIMIDEAHERGQNIDFALGLLKDLLSRRDDLKVLITSATIDSEKFSRYFWDAPVVNIPGRTYPVDVVWSNYGYEASKNLWSNSEKHTMNEVIAEKIEEIHLDEPEGDILVFVAGVEDINSVTRLMEEKELEGCVNGLVILPAHGLLDPNEQRKIFARYPGKRKVVVATNIAETSITLDGVVYVIDSGLIKQTNFHPEAGIQSLDLAEHSRSGCDQRKGRAGRTRPGKCYRMYSEDSFKARPEFTKPEILRMSLANVVLLMEDMGIRNVRNFDFVDKPDPSAFREAYETLIALGAIDKEKKGLTKIGKEMADLPLEPRISRMLLEAEKYGCIEEVAIISAFLSVRTIFARPKEKEREADLSHSKFKDSHSDALTFLKVWKGYLDSGSSGNWCFENFLNAKSLQEVSKILLQMINILGQNGISMISKEKFDPEKVMKSVAMGLVNNLYMSGGFHSYTPVCKDSYSGVYVHPGSSVFGAEPKFIVVGKILRTTKDFAHIVTKVDPSWLSEMVPDRCELGEIELQSFDEEKGIVHAVRDIRLDGIRVGIKKLDLDIPTADKIQQKRILEAKGKGWIPLTFKKEQGIYSYMEDYFGTYNGDRFKAYFSSVDEGITYYCETEVILGSRYARAQFKVFNFQSIEEKMEEAPKSQIESLLSMYGAKTNKRERRE